MKGLNVLSETFFSIERLYYYIQNTLLKMLSLMHRTKIIKEVDDYRAGFWEVLSDLRTCYLILNSEFPGFCSVFYDLVFLEAFCIFWCLVVAGFCFFFFLQDDHSFMAHKSFCWFVLF